MPFSCAGCGQSIWSQRRTFCDRCEAQRKQHATSHTMEGHREAIKMCPICEQVFK